MPPKGAALRETRILCEVDFGFDDEEGVGGGVARGVEFFADFVEGVDKEAGTGRWEYL